MIFKVFSIVLLFNAIYSKTTTASIETLKHFEDAENEKFIHLIVNGYNGRVYVGAVNKIYQLSDQLALEAVVEMGPLDDSPECPVSSNCAQIAKTKTDYWNKALVIDYSSSRLISCGSLFQGACSVHKLNNITSYETARNEAVVANNPTGSTVAYIAPGPSDLSRMHVLYVGVSYTGHGPYRSEVPAVSSRSLDPKNMFSIAEKQVTTGTQLMVNSLARDRFPINYVYGFASQGFSYFITIQSESTEKPKPFISKLIRVCQNDESYYSYTEVPLICQTPGEINYNLAQAAFVGKVGSELAASLGVTTEDEVLFVVFAKSKNENDEYNEPSNSSALCIYALSAIRKMFTQNIQHCFNGVGNLGLDFIIPNQRCIPTRLQIDDDFCGIDVNTPLGGSIPIETTPVLTYSNVLLTSVATTVVHSYTIAFLGTNTGNLKKVVIESNTSAHEYNETLIDDGKSVNADMFFNPQNENYLYVMTKKRVTLVKVHECQLYRTFNECMASGDPYCGWCTLEKKCSVKADCKDAGKDKLFWLSYKSGEKVIINRVFPSQTQITTARWLYLVIDNISLLRGHLFCRFTTDEQTFITNATLSAYGIHCPTPSSDKLVPIPYGYHHLTAKLYVQMEDGTDMAAILFTFYDCRSYIRCTECVLSPFPCNWCVGGHKCTRENCRNDVLVTGVSSIRPSILSGPRFCPRINLPSDRKNEFLVPFGRLQKVYVTIDNILPFIATTRFSCLFNIEGKVESVNAHLLGDRVYCDSFSFQYKADVPTINASFAVIWDGNKPLDNPENIHLLIYRCDAMARNCGFCLELPEKFNCGWCQDHCDIEENCAKNRSRASWLNNQEICPDPKITDFYPKSGPIEGGTNITIEGLNLGRKFEDIENGVHIANELSGSTVKMINCIPFKEFYEKTSKIICKVLIPPNATNDVNIGSVTGPVIVNIQNLYTATSKEHFKFVNPIITAIEPAKGPVSGGTKLIISGLYLDAGSMAIAKIGKSNCEIISRDTKRIECITKGRDMTGEEKVSVTFDNGERKFEDYGYLYVEDPIVSYDKSRLNENIPKGIPIGGIKYSVKGEHFDSIQSSMMYVEVNGVKYNGSCIVESSKNMKCKSPKVPFEKLAFDENGRVELDYGFIMDSVKSVMDLSKRVHKPFPKFQMHRNPQFFEFTEENKTKHHKSDYLTINGINLDGAAQPEDITVKIGNAFCKVTSLSRSQLTCIPPSTQPPAIRNDGELDYDSNPELVVAVADSLIFSIGKVSYDLPTLPPLNSTNLSQ
ncbi:plexin A-like protein [Dinothrombium tinctorium]|uniref:Plexin A-like protein n=1 Tax=Dinothrombium tinctorium TaxID=1965070 RepID=A0A3S3NWV8_9ACAR|nr:plexin A-like protein [Dinothrombium tinctorium]